jgi:hypothetical protein
MKHFNHWTIGLTAFALTASAALADWYRAAELHTTGGAKEVSANFQNVQAVQLQWLDGEVDILVFWVRSVGEKKEFLVERRLDRGETIDFALDGRSVTGFRVIDKGNGRYCINVQSDDTQYFEHHRHHHPRLPPPDGLHDPRHDGDHAAPPPGDHPDGDRYDPRQPPPSEKPGPALKKDAPKGPDPKAAAKAPPKKTAPKSAPKAPARRGPPKGH